MKYRQAVIAVVLAVAAAGCGPGTVTPPPASVSPTAISSPATTESATSPAVTPSGSSPSTGTQTLPLPDYTGPQTMPASDGKPMLWPLSSKVSLADPNGDLYDRYGFLDVTGTLVLPQRYTSFAYCPEASGRPVHLIANRSGEKVEVYDLTGKLLRRLPALDGRCAGTTHVVFTHWVEPELNQHNDGLIDLATGEVTLPMAKERHITTIDDHTVNVSDPSGEFFLDLTTGRRTPHPGWVLENDATLEAGAPGVPAATVPSGALIGFLRMDGTWALTPRYDEVGGFTGGFTSARLDVGQWTFLDSTLHEVGGKWKDVEAVTRDRVVGWRTLGYRVTDDGQQALLDASLHPVVPAQNDPITCDWSAQGACTVAMANTLQLVVLPEATTSTLPRGVDQALSRWFAADGAPPTEEGTTRVLALETGVTVALDPPTSCRPAGDAWLACQPGGPTLAPTVLDRQGRRTAFASAQPIYDPVEGTPYFEVTAGRYRGIVDATGNWLYRTSIYYQLED